jgi:hypothetical protein
MGKMRNYVDSTNDLHSWVEESDKIDSLTHQRRSV